MTLLLLSALLAAGASLFVIGPILARRSSILADAAPGALLDAEARRRATLASLKDLEYDWLGGKLDQADYLAQREKLSQEALAAMRAADAVERELSGEVAGVVDGSVARRVAVGAIAGPPHDCGFANPAGSRFCGGCGKRLR